MIKAVTYCQPLKCVELFAGVGGLALGASQAGLEHLTLIEKDKQCCQALRHNKKLGHPFVKEWPLVEDNVCNVDFSQYAGQAAIVCGGPPCQPFSLGGKGEGEQDCRDMFPQAVRAVREIHPDAFVFENVKGLLRPGFANYVEYIRLQLAYPQLLRRENEMPDSYLRRLQKCHMKGEGPKPVYQVEIHLANAANFGVPQNRERVFIVGFKKDLHADWGFPEETHSRQALIADKASGSYYERHKIPKRLRPIASHLDLPKPPAASGKAPWKTLRDALHDLGEPDAVGAPPNHVFIDGARIYNGHTGSVLDLPAKTVKAGGHGVPGGENMFVSDKGEVRYLTVRESARVQTFPDTFEFPEKRTVSMRQLGNAVPCELARVVLDSVRASIVGARRKKV